MSSLTDKLKLKLSEEQLTNILEEKEKAPDKHNVLKLLANSNEIYAKTIFPNRFFRPFSPDIHSKIFDALDDDSLQFVAIAAPRGVGKTSILNLSFPSKTIAFRERKFILIISATATAAVEQCDNLKDEITHNEKLLDLFGNPKGERWSSERWEVEWKYNEVNEKGELVLDYRNNPIEKRDVIRVIPRGAGQQIRGKLFKDFRPDLIIVDDLEDPENMDSEEQRRKKKQWFFADVKKAIDQYTPREGEKRPRIIVLGTILHEQSLLQELLDDPEFYSIRLEICGDDLKSKWPEAITDEEIRKDYELNKERGILDVFFREMRNLPTVTGVDADFNDSMYKYYDERKVENIKNLFNVVITDPAKKSANTGAKTAINGISVDPKTESIYHRRCINDFLDPGQIIEKTIDMALEIKADYIAIEVTGLNEFATYPLKNTLVTRGLQHINVIELKARRGGSKGDGKVQRVLSLKPFYRAGQIYHSRVESRALESQLTAFPRPAYWDVMDSFAYIVEILEMGYIYFDDENYENDDKFEEQYLEILDNTDEALEYEQPL